MDFKKCLRALTTLPIKQNQTKSKKKQNKQKPPNALCTNRKVKQE